MAEKGSEPEEFWLFGYGQGLSLPNKTPRRLKIFLKSNAFTNIFLPSTAHSEDHRGTPEFPGRVVTLISASDYKSLIHDEQTHPSSYRVYGAAYRILPSRVVEVKDYLDIREINGYSIEYTTFYPCGSSISADTTKPPSIPGGSTNTVRNVVVYIGLPSNPQFLGPQDPEVLAERIVQSTGPSGENREYLFMLETALGQLLGEEEEKEEGRDRKNGEGNSNVDVDADGHVGDLARRVRMIIAREEGKGTGREGNRELEMVFSEEAVRREGERVEEGGGAGELEEIES
ncbi:MAG: hypothetical protein MMC33_002807 [Icmadophila ericetorum]|nr:hypothetical protein [Icmadophila ericetorum]